MKIGDIVYFKEKYTAVYSNGTHIFNKNVGYKVLTISNGEIQGIVDLNDNSYHYVAHLRNIILNIDEYRDNKLNELGI